VDKRFFSVIIARHYKVTCATSRDLAASLQCLYC